METMIEHVPDNQCISILLSQGRGPTHITFENEQGQVVGVLYLGPPMRFEGDVEESARMFVERVIKEYCQP